MKELCEKLAEQYAEDKSKAYYIDQNGDQKWYITERGRYSKEDFLAGYKAAKLEGMRPKTDVIGDALNSSAARHAVALLGDKPINPPMPSDQELHLRAMTSLSIGTSSHTNIQFVPGMGWVKKV